MKPILEQLFDGELYPAECLTVTETYRALHSSFTQTCGAFEQSLSPAQRELFETMMNQSCDLDNLILRQKFSLGFCLGARMMLEVLQPEKFHI